MKQIQHRSDCPIAYSLDFLGDKWIILILRDLIFTNKKSYGDFLTSDERIATNVLADRLKLLEKNGFIKSTVSPEKKNKFNYSLTEKSIDLIPMILELMIWGSKYDSFEKKDIIKSIEKDKNGVLLQLREKLLSSIKSDLSPKK